MLKYIVEPILRLLLVIAALIRMFFAIIWDFRGLTEQIDRSALKRRDGTIQWVMTFTCYDFYLDILLA